MAERRPVPVQSQPNQPAQDQAAQEEPQQAQEQPAQNQQSQNTEPMTFTGTVVGLGNTTTVQFLQRQQLDDQLGPASAGQLQLAITDQALLSNLQPGQQVEVTITPGKTPQEQQDEQLGGQATPQTRQVLPRTAPNARRGPAGFAPMVAPGGGQENTYGRRTS